MRLNTRLIHFDAAPGDPNRPMVTPIYQTATFAQESATEFGAYDYSRSGNPTRTVLEDQLAMLEGGQRAFAFSSGMAALSAVTRLVGAGEEIVAGIDLYGGTYRLLSRILPHYGIEVTFVDTRDLDAVERAISVKTRLLLIETPTNPMQHITDLRQLTAIAHHHGCWVAVDNSLLSPYLQQPLKLGADIVIHSATKYLSGHSDVTAGAVVVDDEAIGERLYLLQNGEGTALAPFECWLLSRGLKTLSVRMDRQIESARAVAHFLDERSEVLEVYYPGLEGHPGYELHCGQASGPGALISFVTGDVELSKQIVNATRLFSTAVSFGSVSSVISLPCYMSHASIPSGARRGAPLPKDLVRLSVGIESVSDLLADLDAAFGVGLDESVQRIGGVHQADNLAQRRIRSVG